MKNWRESVSRLAVAAAMAVLLTGCGEKDLAAKDPVWDRQVCDRCQMAVSDRHFAAQVVDAKTGKRFYFDDLGCALMWLQTQKPAAPGDLVLWATAADSGRWVEVRKGVIARGFVTPMSYGLGVFAQAKDVPAGKETLTVDEATAAVEGLRKMRGAHGAHGPMAGTPSGMGAGGKP